MHLLHKKLLGFFMITKLKPKVNFIISQTLWVIYRKFLIHLLFLILTSWLSRLVQSSKSNSFLHETVFSIIANNKTAPLLWSVFWLEFSIEEVSRSILNGLSKEIYRPISIKKQDSMTLLVVGLWCSWLATRWKPFFIKNWFCCSWVHLNFCFLLYT